MKREFSAGGIVFNSKGQVLLINNMAMRDPSKSYWGFPKGHIDPKESSKDAAIREVREEVGLEVEVLEKIGDSKYVFTSPKTKEKIFKVVIMFLMKEKGAELKVLKEELMGAEWFDPKVALEKLSFRNDKYLLKKALLLLS